MDNLFDDALFIDFPFRLSRQHTLGHQEIANLDDQACNFRLYTTDVEAVCALVASGARRNRRCERMVVVVT